MRTATEDEPNNLWVLPISHNLITGAHNCAALAMMRCDAMRCDNRFGLSLRASDSGRWQQRPRAR